MGYSNTNAALDKKNTNAASILNALQSKTFNQAIFVPVTAWLTHRTRYKVQPDHSIQECSV